MRQRQPKAKPRHRLFAYISTSVTLALCLGLIGASFASAAFEQVGNFAGTPEPTAPSSGPWPEEVQFGALGGMAVNYTGAGGVPAGTIYAAAGENGGHVQISRYNPDGSFSERWSFAGSPAPNERCGPEGEPAHSICQSQPGGGPQYIDVDVDQNTGNVYVLKGSLANTGEKAIRVYSPDGSKLIAEFGERAASNEGFATSPEKLHGNLGGTEGAGVIAVNAEGDVYVFDIDRTKNSTRPYRLMKFEPQSPGDYEHYVYAGTDQDLALATKGIKAPARPVVDAAGNLYVANEEGYFAKFDPSQPGAPPLCEFKFTKQGIMAMTVDPENGEVFFSTSKDNSHIHRLEPCEKGEFIEGGAIPFFPKRSEIGGLTFDPRRQFSPGRPAGVLYAGALGAEGGQFKEEGGKIFQESSLGYIFSQPVETPPTVGSESFTHVTSTTAELGAQVNPKGSATNYVFQYLPESAYEANEPDEVQSLTLSATGGLFGLAFEGEHPRREVLADLTAGSNTATALKATAGTGTLKAASGSGDLSGAEGKGTVIKGSKTISSVTMEKGSFEAGQGIAGPGIPAGATITGVVVEAESSAKDLTFYELTISAAATESAAHLSITSATNKITALSTTEGAFEVGQAITGEGIGQGTTIAAASASELTLSAPASKPISGDLLKAGSTKVTSLAQSTGSFEVGRRIEGEGIPANTEITAKGAGELTLSAPATKPGSAVALTSPYPGPGPLALGEQVEGPGIPAGTKITSVGGGQMTLSNAATASGKGVLVHAGLSATAGAAEVRLALEGLAKIGEGGVEVSGGPGDETGSSPYRVTFTGKLENRDVPELETEDLTLTGGSSSATVQTEHGGGEGFSTGALESPPGGAFAGEGSEPVTVTGPLVGLQPGTAYRFRAVATSHCSIVHLEKLCEGAGEALSFRTAPVEAVTLPDHRAYEMVSPVDKQSGEVLPANPRINSCGIKFNTLITCKPGENYLHFPMQSAPDGNAVIYEGTPFDSEASGLHENQYIARRDPGSGWQTTNLTPTHLGSGSRQGYLAFNSDLSGGVLRQRESILSPEAPAAYEDLYSQPANDPFALTSLLNETQTFHRSAQEFGLEYAGASADRSRIFFSANDALTEETPFAPEAVDGGLSKSNLYEWHEGQLSLVNVLPGNSTTQPGASFGPVSAHTISKDGTRAFFSDESGQVYVREDGEVTREVETEGIPDPGKFVTAAVDGSKVLLNNGHLHLLDEEGEPTEDLTQGKGGFQGVVGESEDLSHIYFVDTEVLDETPNQRGEEAEAGKFNLYAWAQGEGTSFVAGLLTMDNRGDFSATGESADWTTPPSSRTAQASPNGRFVAFISYASLTGYDNAGLCEYDFAGNRTGGICQEAFLYDSATGTLVCASCNPRGQQPIGPSFLRLIYRGSAIQPHYLSNEGRLLFDSRDSIVPADVNNGVEDVYEWEPKGVGSCEAEFAEGGCVSLISAGTGTVDSNFMAMDESGANVFFTTRDQLALKDKDGLIDLYDARAGGGIGAESEVARTECQGEACQAQTSAPNDPTPGSSTFQGAGNVKEEAKAKKHAKKHKKKRHAKKHSNKRAAKSNRGGAK